ncbi:acyl-CoA N-acyltransferase [Thelephora terrestris]|uniref:N-alpha-acetyltransferase 40 n=1 Tax=Thelephora terrestris TaxID=56493 RepID=A0A9P6HEM1_9AGAM|nr:acyl-CoA N-acyltransferase [Thelephora terrestris]
MEEEKRALLCSSIEASPEELVASILPDDREIHHPSGDLQVGLVLASSLSAADKGIIWRILADAMKEMYEGSSFGWNPTKKKRELFHKLARFILVRTRESAEVVAFTSFRFEEEDGFAVVYCYELHVSPNFHRCGLGRKLARMLFDICRQRRLDKVMLTVFKANTIAIRFYENIGFVLDPSSPEYGSTLPADDGDDSWEDEGGGHVNEECDYMILSKAAIPSSYY